MPLVSRLIREPLVHFLGIGALVFVLYGADETTSAAPPETVISVTAPRIEQLEAQFEAVWRRKPSAVERASLVEGHVREEVYYREALALGLDRDDPVIRRRLRQKMEFLGGSIGSAVVPEEAPLRAHHAAHPERFATPARVTFRQVALRQAGDAAAVRAAIEAGTDPASLGRLGLLPAWMEGAGNAAVDGAFGSGFFNRITQLAPGGWQGPVESAYGSHLVQVVAFEPGAVLPFEAVRELVRQDWQRAKAEEMREAQYAALRARYEIVLPDDAR